MRCGRPRRGDITAATNWLECLSADERDLPLRVRQLRKRYGRGRWRKLKGIATIRLPNGAQRKVELHWYETHGVGKREMKIKRYLDE